MEQISLGLQTDRPTARQTDLDRPTATKQYALSSKGSIIEEYLPK